MSTALPLAVAGKTDRGRVRELNEDGFTCEESLGLYAVADGLGGLPKGELASKLSLEELERQVRALPPGAVPAWQAIFTRINKIVLETGRTISADMGIGSTLTAVKATPGALHLGHIGDSGLFVFAAPGRSTQATKDQTMAQELLDKHGEAMRSSIPESYHHTLTQCIGQPVSLVVECRQLDVHPGMRVVLYTDGVTKTMELPELSQLVFAAPNPRSLVEKIVALANERGGPDNVTAVALFY